MIDERTYAASSPETGGLYDEAGLTTANAEGDPMSEAEERDARPPEVATDAEGDPMSEAEERDARPPEVATDADEPRKGPGVAEVFGSGS